MQYLALLPKFITDALLSFHGIFPCWEMHLSLLLFLCHSAGVLLAQSPPNGSRLLGSEVEREVLLAGIEFAEGVTLVSVDNGQDTGN